MNRIKDDDSKPPEPRLTVRDPSRCSPDPKTLKDWLFALEHVTIDDFRDMSINRSNVESIGKTLELLSQQPPLQLKGRVLDWLSNLQPAARRLALTFRSPKLAKFLLALTSSQVSNIATVPAEEMASRPALEFNSALVPGSQDKELPKFWNSQNPDLLTLLSCFELADGSSILDTVSISGLSIASVEAMERVSSGQTFLRPASIRRYSAPGDEEIVWEFPAWAALESTVSGVVGGIIERLGWLAYAVHLDENDKIQPGSLNCFRELELMVGAWKVAVPRQRAELLGLFKESPEKCDCETLLPRLFFIPLKDLALRKACRAFIDSFILSKPSGCSESEATSKKKTEPEAATPLVPNKLIQGSNVVPIVSTAGNKMIAKQNEFFTLEDDLINTSESTQLSAKSKCGSRRASIDEQQSLLGRDLARFGTLFGEANLLFWLYNEEDTEPIAVKTTNKLVGNVIDRLGAEDGAVTTAENEIDFFWDLERETGKDVVAEMADFGKEVSGDIIKTFWNTSRKSNGQLRLFAKEETRVCELQVDSAAGRGTGNVKGGTDAQSVEKTAKKQKQSEFSASVEEQKVISEQDVRSVWKQHTMQAKQRYDYLKMPTKTWPLRPTTSNFYTPTPFIAPEAPDKSDRKAEEKTSISQATTQTAVAGTPTSISESISKKVADLHRTLTVQLAAAVQKIEHHQGSLEPYRNRLVSAMEKAIKKHFAGQKVELEIYGSTRNGLAIESSDIDLRIVGLNLKGAEDLRLQIKGLEKSLRTEKYIKSTTAILSAKVPVMKLTADYEALVEDFPEEGVEQFQKVDITVDEEGKGGARLTVDLVGNLLRSMVHLKGVVLILKKLLGANGLNIPFTGNSSDLDSRRIELLLPCHDVCRLPVHVWGMHRQCR